LACLPLGVEITANEKRKRSLLAKKAFQSAQNTSAQKSKDAPSPATVDATAGLSLKGKGESGDQTKQSHFLRIVATKERSAGDTRSLKKSVPPQTRLGETRARAMQGGEDKSLDSGKPLPTARPCPRKTPGDAGRTKKEKHGDGAEGRDSAKPHQNQRAASDKNETGLGDATPTAGRTYYEDS